MTTFQKKLWIGLVVMALLSPLGIILPEEFRAEDAWGEWGTDKLERLLGYVPEGLKNMADLWKSPITDYNFGGEGSSFAFQIVSYVISGFLGIILVGGMVYAISKFVVKRG